jgi:hypothetical protein
LAVRDAREQEDHAVPTKRRILIADLSLLLANYGTTSGASYGDGDLDDDGDVDLSDLSALLAVYGTTCP